MRVGGVATLAERSPIRRGAGGLVIRSDAEALEKKASDMETSNPGPNPDPNPNPNPNPSPKGAEYGDV